MNDKAILIEAIDGELRRALAVAPSVDFTARLRQRVAQEPPSAGGREWATFVAMAVASIAVWIAAFGPRPQGGDVRPFVAAPSHVTRPADKSIVSVAVPPTVDRRVGAQRAQPAGSAGGARIDEGLAPDAAVPALVERWPSGADAVLVSDTRFDFPMATTLVSAPVVALDVREPNEGLLEGRAASIALSYESQWSEQ